MKFLVHFKAHELFPALAPPQLKDTMNNMVFPSLTILQQWESEGRISGGIVLGKREGMFMVEAASAAELDAMLLKLPFWGMMETTVTSLVSIAERREQEEALLNQAGK